MDVILVVIGTFALCFGVDKLFTKLFRSQAEHKTGLSVRLNKYYGVFGLVLTAIGIAALISGILDTWMLAVCGALVVLIGVCLIVYFMTFGVFYDKETFVLTTFGKKSHTYRYEDIKCQQLYVLQGGSVVVELQMTDGRAFQLQSTMDGAYPFLDHAYSAWLRQTGRNPEECTFHDTANSCWFPSADAEE